MPIRSRAQLTVTWFHNHVAPLAVPRDAPKRCNRFGSRFRYSLNMDSLRGIPELASYISALSIAMHNSK